jgi:hypothetical protein
MVWELWNNGEVPATAALGVLIILFLITATIFARKLSARSL